MKWKAHFEDSGISDDVIRDIDSPDIWDAELQAKAMLPGIIADRLLHKDHAYLAIIRRADR